MNTSYKQNHPDNLSVVIGNQDPKAVEVFFNGNKLVHHLIRRHPGEKLSEVLYEQIYAEVCIQLLQAKPGSYDPDYAPSTFLVNTVKEARRIVLSEQAMIYRPRSAPKDEFIVFDEYVDEIDEHDGAPNIGMRAIDIENWIDANIILDSVDPAIRTLLVETHWCGEPFKKACEVAGVERTRAYRQLEKVTASLH